MGKPTGFLEYTRELPLRRPVAERINDYNEFVLRYSDTKLNQQSARCMDCGVPFCHNGCPLGNLIPEFNDAVYRGAWAEAYEVLSSTNNFPEFTGRICPAPCESACVLGINQPAITIEEIEKHIIEIAFEKGLVKPQPPTLRTGKTVAVVGSGPAGMAAAAQLNQAGHSVTVFERDEAPGGLLRYGIPDFKLEKWVVDRRVNLMEEEGIVFRCNTNVGQDVSVDDLLSGFDAVVLAGGSTIPRELDVPGKNLNGVHFAMDFLGLQNRRLTPDPRPHPASPPSPSEKGKGNESSFSKMERSVADAGNTIAEILAIGKNVVVIGGGDTGSDCVGTSNRHGAATITQFELLPKPAAERTLHMPWPSFPMTLKVTSSHEEGTERHWAIATKEFVGDEAGHLRALKVVDLEWKLVDGRASEFVEVPGTEREIPCELALLAMGFVHPQHDGLIDDLNVEKDNRGNVKASEIAYQTSIPKVFAAGDMRRGQSLVVWAISEGRECARKVDQFLMGSSQLPSKDESELSQTWGF